MKNSSCGGNREVRRGRNSRPKDEIGKGVLGDGATSLSPRPMDLRKSDKR